MSTIVPAQVDEKARLLPANVTQALLPTCAGTILVLCM